MKISLLTICLLAILNSNAFSKCKNDSVTVFAGTISGSSSVCFTGSGSANGYQYTVSGSSAYSGYTWTVPSDVTITSGQGTKTITVNFNSPGMAKTK